MGTTITVQFLSHLSRHVGSRNVEVHLDDPPTVRQLLSKLAEMFGNAFTDNFLNDKGGFHDAITFLVNGLNLKQYESKYSDPFFLELAASDDVAFLVQFGGG